MQKLINAFREGENEILLRKLGEEEADFHYEAGDFSDKRVLLIEWTHAGNPTLKVLTSACSFIVHRRKLLNVVRNGHGMQIQTRP